MTLTLRPTHLSRDPHAQDWTRTIHEDGREIGRLFSPTLTSSW
jgi:hypothetical protein